jgi:hypothetical protein
MITLEQIMASGSAALERQGARLIDFDEAQVTIESGIGMRKSRAEVSLSALIAWLDAHPEQTRQGVASFFRGAGAVAVAPRPNRRESAFSFAEAAGRLFPSIEGPLFSLGAEAAAKEPLFLWPAADGLQVAFFIELDTGRKVLTQGQVDAWGANPDRIERAAVSMLFHRTYQVEPAAYQAPGLSHCRAFKSGDGYDSARALLLESLYYPAAGQGLRFSLPTPELLLVIEAPGQDETTALRTETERLFAESAWSLSREVYEWREGLLVRAVASAA